MRLLIVGSNGQLGHDLMAQARQRGWMPTGADMPVCDITDRQSVERAIESAGPADVPVDIMINAAAYTAVDKAESEPEIAFAVNRDGAEVLARAGRDHQIPLIHVSTDYVFDGRQTRPYRPTDPVNPQGVYGKSKAEGEARIRQLWERHVIVRTAWLFGRHGANFVKTMIRLGKERDTIRVVDDQVGCPTYAGDLAGALLDAAADVTGKTDGWGTYHYCNEGAVTWYGFTRRILTLAGRYERIRVGQILPIPTSEYPLPAPRPQYSVLDCTSFEADFGVTRRPWEAALQEMLAGIYGTAS
ncbi:dTDP-4-dehydrorhamnose reductase [Desulfatitalea tepidiphila]|uniref:dTDP-4-dehydrorhamnose reductase n=1 Tax=Desulfatitalea tepidiphila TaxID=1185843 RepID=UPI0006B5928B|nr:dTDP-4-dehydrorhamnose reductase [Desulfatitalea tepidiphila]